MCAWRWRGCCLPCCSSPSSGSPITPENGRRPENFRDGDATNPPGLAAFCLLFLGGFADGTGLHALRRSALAHRLVGIAHGLAVTLHHFVSALRHWLHAWGLWLLDPHFRHAPPHHRTEKFPRPEYFRGQHRHRLSDL